MPALSDVARMGLSFKRKTCKACMRVNKQARQIAVLARRRRAGSAKCCGASASAELLSARPQEGARITHMHGRQSPVESGDCRRTSVPAWLTAPGVPPRPAGDGVGAHPRGRQEDPHVGRLALVSQRGDQAAGEG